ncbi:MAG: 50S ribosomal protein L11 methyltransferase [Bacillota bacterium]|nr:50S ribosomal protein L11 methyltransferase [Bacillota bacterium]
MVTIFQISFNIKHSEIDDEIEKLAAIDLYSTYYEEPFQVTVDSNGYGYYEKEEEIINMRVFPETGSREECIGCIDKIRNLLDINEEIILSELKDDNWQEPFEPIDLENGWIIAEPNVPAESLKKINFESQGSFGTGLHETTQDFLRYILEYDFTGLTVLDLGTGSGILSIAAGLKNAKRIVALDIRDVTSEVMYNAALNNLENIEVVVADVTLKNSGINEKFDAVFINIGGEETLASMELINAVIKQDGILIVSGLVEWSSNDICKELEAQGYQLVKSTKTNEWVTMILKRL